MSVDRLVDRDFSRLNIRPAFLTSFEKIRAHHLSLLVVQHHGEIAK
ncbi:MAG TPA: hypothetical protein VM656_03825 [Pyrinomonadaceae bacterium]|nr:hypothetical protein [Pyrinomonadaceae bacterium]